MPPFSLSGHRSLMLCMFLPLQLLRFSPMDHKLGEYYAKVQGLFLFSFNLETKDIHLLAFLFVFSRYGSTNGIFFISTID
jgi:hypothetical protein